MPFTDQMLSLIDKAVLCWLATSDKDGAPNVSPKEMFCAPQNDRLLIADIASPKSISNLGENPQICVSLIDIFEQKGLKILGTAEVISPTHDDFAAISRPLVDMAGPSFPVRNVIHITPRRIAPIIAPSYHLLPERTDDDRRQSAYQAYGVRPLS